MNDADQACKIPEGLPLEYKPIPCAACGGMPRFIVRESRVGKQTIGFHFVEHECNKHSIKIKMCPFIKEAIDMIRVGGNINSAVSITKWNAAQRYIAKLAERIV